MTQFQYDAIMKILQNGAPALCQELAQSVSQVITDNNTLTKEKEELTKKVQELEAQLDDKKKVDEVKKEYKAKKELN